MFRCVRNLPAVVFAMVLVGEEIEFGLKILQVLRIPGLCGLAHVQQPLLLFRMNAERPRAPAALFKAISSSLRVGAIREEEVVIEGLRAGESLIDLHIDFRPLWMAAKQ